MEIQFHWFFFSSSDNQNDVFVYNDGDVGPPHQGWQMMSGAKVNKGIFVILISTSFYKMKLYNFTQLHTDSEAMWTASICQQYYLPNSRYLHLHCVIYTSSLKIVGNSLYIQTLHWIKFAAQTMEIVYQCCANPHFVKVKTFFCKTNWNASFYKWNEYLKF